MMFACPHDPLHKVASNWMIVPQSLLLAILATPNNSNITEKNQDGMGSRRGWREIKEGRGALVFGAVLIESCGAKSAKMVS